MQTSYELQDLLPGARLFRLVVEDVLVDIEGFAFLPVWPGQARQADDEVERLCRFVIGL